jgi:3-ketosteroid 9alpha-monooxygenase subunit A
MSTDTTGTAMAPAGRATMTPQTLRDMPESIGFPYKLMPTGWFQITWSHQLAVGQVRPLHYFGQEIVLYRTEEGEAVTVSAYCPHLGAHLGHGGTVHGCAIKCPFHGWEWNQDGTNRLVPSDDAPSLARRVLETWPTAESNGVVWVWHDAHRRPPIWPSPAERRHERPFLPVTDDTIYLWDKVRVRPALVTENTVDLDHFVFVHKNRILPVVRQPTDLPELIEDGYRFRLNRAAPLQSTVAEGVGILTVDFPPDPDRPHRMPTLLYANTTPIDDEHSDMFGTVLVEQDWAAEGAGDTVPVGNALKRVVEQKKQAGVDIPIWSNMIYLQRPAYARHEGRPFKMIRNFIAKFHPDSGVALDL